MTEATQPLTYRGFAEPTLDADALTMWRQGVDTVLDYRAKPEDTTIYIHRGCPTCQAIRRDWRTRDTWIEQSYWKPIRDAVPTDVLLDMSIAEIHAIHHLGEPGYSDAVIFAAIRVLVNYWASQDTVLRTEMNRHLSNQAAQQWRELAEVKTTANEKARADYEGRLREAGIRIANVEALVSLAFAAKHKTMRYDEVRAAIEWRTGDEIPQTTVDRQREMQALQGRTPR